MEVLNPDKMNGTSRGNIGTLLYFDKVFISERDSVKL